MRSRRPSAKDRASAALGNKPEVEQPAKKPKPKPKIEVLGGALDIGDLLPPDSPPVEEKDGGAPPELEEAIANAKLEPQFQRIVDDVFESSDTPEDMYEAVKSGLQLKSRASAADYGTLADALDQAEDLTRQAHKLYVQASDRDDAYVRDLDMVFGTMRDVAVARLEEQKRDKTRTKQITDKDVEAEMATVYPEQWQDLHERKRRSAMTVKHLEDLHRRAGARAVHLRTMVRGRQGGLE